MSSNRDRKKQQKRLLKSNNYANVNIQPANSQTQQTEERTVNDSSSIIRHGAGNLETFELRESELEKLESYTWGGRFFDFGLNGVTVAITILISMFSSENMNETVKGVFIVLLIICSVGGLVCFRLAYLRSKERTTFFKCIRER